MWGATGFPMRARFNGGAHNILEEPTANVARINSRYISDSNELMDVFQLMKHLY
jgi:hypothetical protein